MKNGKESKDIPYMKPFISVLKLDALTPVSIPLFDKKIEIKCITSYEFFLNLSCSVNPHSNYHGQL